MLSFLFTLVFFLWDYFLLFEEVLVDQVNCFFSLLPSLVKLSLKKIQLFLLYLDFLKSFISFDQSFCYVGSNDRVLE